ncbi:hypothetical protein AVEN_235422-1 [Araneus ventricosus]|uniref:Uncharacterized protein n=1 Tax=Araneus ventricosus TaxID=182803 RepID=A0A4Y2A3Q2_ARAVE|nr:hypothetical protein AVEN_235422-1 [Araneus ventricosus]
MSDAELQKYFEFELAPFPLSLFDEGGLRKTLKSVFYDLFSIATDLFLTSACYVVDGGFLLHRVLWQTKESFSFILKKYVDHTKKHFNEGGTVVFDGYSKDAAKSTKSVESIRRTKKYIAGYVMFGKSISTTMFEEKILSYDKNKQRLINMLCFKFQKEGFVVKQAEEDADYLIKSALEIEKWSQCFVVVGEGLQCTDSSEDDNIVTNPPNQEAKIDIRIEEIISDVDLEEECQTWQVEESDSKKIDINDCLTFNI